MRNVTGFFVVVMLCLAMLAPMPLEASVVIEFQQGAATGGWIDFYYGDTGGIQARGSVPISMMTVSGSQRDGTYKMLGQNLSNTPYAQLGFFTGSGLIRDDYGWTYYSSSEISLLGSIPNLGIDQQYVVTTQHHPAFRDVSIELTPDKFSIVGTGIDAKSPYLFKSLGLELPIDDDWPAMYFSLTMKGEALDLGGYKITSAVLTNTYAAPVPIPAAVWLLGSGLIGLIGIRKIRK